MPDGGELAGARTGVDLVPGAPHRVSELAEQLQAMAQGLGAADRLMNTWSAPSWSGAAALAFVHLMRSVPQPYACAARAMAGGAQAVRAHAAALVAAQRVADEAIELERRASALLRTSALPSPAQLQAAAALRAHGLRLLEQARASVRSSAAAAADSLRTAARAAPEQPNALVRLVRGLIDLQRELQLGAVESTLTTLTALALASPNRLLIDPAGWAADARQLAAGVRAAAGHPGQVALAVVDWPTLRENPERWVGHLLPDVLAGLATGGLAPVANRGVSVGVRAASVLAPPTVRAELRAVAATARATSRSRLRASDLRPYGRRGADVRLSATQHLLTAALARDARWAQRDLTPRVQQATGSLDVRLQGLEHVVKSRESLYRKVSERLGQPGAMIETVVPQVNDTVRYTLLADPQRYAGAVLDVIPALHRQQLTLVQAKDFWGGPRYRGLNLTFADGRTGRLVEVQVHTPASWEATVQTHGDYERWRQGSLPDAERARLATAITAVYAQVPPPPGLGALDLAVDMALDMAAVAQASPLATNRAPQLLSAHPWAQPVSSAGALALTSVSCVDEHRSNR